MKRLTILSLVLGFFLGSDLQAQTEKGKLWISGMSQLELNQGVYKQKFNGNVDDGSKYSYYNLNFGTKIGYLVINNMPLGMFMEVDYFGGKDKDDGDKDRSYEFAIGPFIRYYFADLVGFKPYGEASVGFGFYRNAYKTELMDDWDKYKESYFTFRVGGGATYYFNDFIGMDLFLGFNHEAWTHKEEDVERATDKTTYLYSEFLMQMGVVVMLDCRK